MCCVALVTVAGQSFAKRLLAPRVKQEWSGVFRALVTQRNPNQSQLAEANIITATTVVMVNGSSLSKNHLKKKRTMCQQTFHHQLYNTKLGLVHLKWAVILLVTGVVTRIVLIQTTQPQEFGGAPFVVASNFRVVTPLSNKLKGLTLIFYSIILKKILLWMQIKRIVTLKIVLGNDSWSNS
jgi:uncharacterized membrane protein YeiB